MEPSDTKRFFSILTSIADYYGKSLSEGVQDLYWQGLRQYGIGAVEKALWEHTQNPDNGQFMPKIADVTRCMQGRTVDQAALAWSKVDQALRRVGTYADVVFDDAVIHRVLTDMGGWIKLGQGTEDEWPFTAKQFETRYRGYKLRGEVPEYHPVMLGIANSHNQKEGFGAMPPVLIGSQKKAEEVMRGGTTRALLQMVPLGAAVPCVEVKQVRAA